MDTAGAYAAAKWYSLISRFLLNGSQVLQGYIIIKLNLVYHENSCSIFIVVIYRFIGI
jgi:hypothetical protein